MIKIKTDTFFLKKKNIKKTALKTETRATISLTN